MIRTSLRTDRTGRIALRDLRSAPKTGMLPVLTRGLPVIKSMTPDRVGKTGNASMDFPEVVGVVFRDPIALVDVKRAGADVRGGRVHMDRGPVREPISTMPGEITCHARDPQKNVRLDRPRSIFVPMTGAPCLRDRDDVRRNPTLDDPRMFRKLADMAFPV